ncbi:MAG TPA: glycosyltransferase family 39 protein, partial [Bacteroidota bacterium]|nr:glycosyltransferase family 39 protein [Bacteroidota bacterium]
MTERFLNVPLRYWILLFLIVGTLAVYLPVKDHEFLLYDDYSYIVKNYYIQPGVTWENIVWAFTSGYAANWHPLTWLSHMLDYQLFGLNPTGHHLHNVLLHLLNSILLFLVMRKMTGAEWASAFVAAVFALHPLHVESVAWASERKDVLSALFWMLTMGAYVCYTQKPGVGRYLLVLLLFVLGLLSKPMLVTLPFVLLLLDYWPLRRFGSPNNSPGQPFAYLLLEKAPLILLSIGFSVVTYHVQQEAGAVSTFDRLPLEVRLGNAIVSYLQYLGKTFWPTDLAV